MFMYESKLEAGSFAVASDSCGCYQANCNNNCGGSCELNCYLGCSAACVNTCASVAR